jgi:hypothetical protein
MRRRLLLGLLAMSLTFVLMASPALARVRAENPHEGVKGAATWYSAEDMAPFNPYIGVNHQTNVANVKLVNMAASGRGFRLNLEDHKYLDGGVVYAYLATQVYITYSDGSYFSKYYTNVSDWYADHQLKIAQTTGDPSRWNIYYDSTPIEYNLYWYTDYRTRPGAEISGYLGSDDAYVGPTYVFNSSRQWDVQTAALYPNCYWMADQGSIYGLSWLNQEYYMWETYPTY